MANEVSFNAEQLDELIEIDRIGNNGFLASLIRDYQTGSVKLMQAMHDALKAQDISGLENAAHSLKSSAALLGLVRTAALCWQIEEGAHFGRFETKPVDELADEHARSLKELIDFQGKLGLCAS